MRFPIIFLVFLSCSLNAQSKYWKYTHFTTADTLRGALRAERTCYDVTYYDLYVDVDTKKKSIKGYNTFSFNAIADFQKIQIDLFENMAIDSIVFHQQLLDFSRKENAVFVQFPNQIVKGAQEQFTVYYHGKPTVAKKPPWDGGFVWELDYYLNPWVSVCCEGIGASLWWPCKDHLSDEPDNGVRITVKVHKKGLVVVCNGNEEAVRELPDGSREYVWAVHYPINTYNVTLNIGEYVHFKKTFKSHEDGENMDLDYYVLYNSLVKAKIHFQQVDTMLHVFEKYFGKYPFPVDGYALVQTPYTGMEHQSAIAFGSRFKNGYESIMWSTLYLGNHDKEYAYENLRVDIPFNHVILHESAHEWFGNSLSCSDLAELWLHEGFATYCEGVYVEEMQGYDEAMKYYQSMSFFIENTQPMLGPVGVNFRKYTTDIYYKGALMLNTLRHLIDNDNKWWGILKTFCKRFKYKSVTSADFAKLVLEKTGANYDYFFKQYLEYGSPPILEYQITKDSDKNNVLKYRWAASGLTNFTMTLEVNMVGQIRSITPTKEWQDAPLVCQKIKDFVVNTDKFYILIRKID